VYQEAPLQRVVFHPQEESVSKNKMQEPAFRFFEAPANFFLSFPGKMEFIVSIYTG
jgi:hypothetical protein